MTVMGTQSPLEAARELAPMIQSCADQIEADRELPQSLFEALADAGLFKLALPRSLGGAEIDFQTYVQVLEEVGNADASPGWVGNRWATIGTSPSTLQRDSSRLIRTD